MPSEQKAASVQSQLKNQPSAPKGLNVALLSWIPTVDLSRKTEGEKGETVSQPTSLPERKTGIKPEAGLDLMCSRSNSDPLYIVPAHIVTQGFVFLFLLHMMPFLMIHSHRASELLQRARCQCGSPMETLISRPSAYRSHHASQSFPQAFHKLPHSITCVASVSVSKAAPPTPSPHWFFLGSSCHPIKLQVYLSCGSA